MKRSLVIIGLFLLGLVAVGTNACTTTNSLADSKSGAQLWGENCLRCHNSPSPETFSDVEWDVAVMHMQVRANLTTTEATKIADFLKTAN